jgi:hypothetical protein
MQQFQYIKHLNSCKVAWHSVNNMRQKGHQDLRYSARADRAGFESKAASEPTLCTGTAVYPEKNVSRKSYHSKLIFDVAVPRRSSSTLFFSGLRFSCPLYAARPYSSPLYSTLLYSTLPDSILRQCLLSYFSASGTCQLDFMIFGANSLLFRNMPTGLDLWSYFSTSGTCQLDLMVFWAMQNFLWLVFF